MYLVLINLSGDNSLRTQMDFLEIKGRKLKKSDDQWLDIWIFDTIVWLVLLLCDWSLGP